MHFQVSDDPIKRLDQLNTLFTEFIFRFDRMDEDKILLIKMNISKWISAGYIISFADKAAPTSRVLDQLNTLNKAYAMIGELLLFRKEQDAAVSKQNFKLASIFRDLQRQQYEKLQELYTQLSTPLPFFSFTSHELKMNQIEQYFLSEYIHKTLATIFNF